MIQRHALLIALAKHALDEQALLAVIGDNGRSGIASFECRRSAVQSQRPAPLLRTVTLITSRRENRLNVRDKADLSIGGKGYAFEGDRLHGSPWRRLMHQLREITRAMRKRSTEMS